MPGQSAQWIATARTLRRAGFGVTGPEVDAVVSQDWPSHVDAMLSANPDADPGAIATPVPALDVPRAPGKGATPAARNQYNQQLSEQQRVLSDWWVRRMVSVGQPVHEKLTLLWHNHFATSAQKVRVAAHMAAQNQKLRTLSLGDFRTLAYAMLTDAATLRWLDGLSNTAKAPNENLAREFMELFALGHGNGYTENDVRNGARALTGWVIGADGQTSVVPKRQDAFRGHPQLRRRGIRRCGAGSAQVGRICRGAAVAAIGFRRATVAAGARPAGRRIWPGTQPAGADPGDPHRQRVHRRLCRRRQHPDRMARRRHAGTAGADRPTRTAQARRRDTASAGAATVQPTERRRLAARPGVAVHRQRGGPLACRHPVGARRRPLEHRGHLARRPHRRGRLPDRRRSVVGPHRNGAAAPGAPTGSVGSGRRQHTRIPDVLTEINRRRFLIASAGAGAAGLLSTAVAVSWPDLMRAAQDRPLPANAGVLVIVTLYGGNDGINTLIPYADNAYHDARPDLAYAPGDVIHLDEQLGLNPAMKGLAQLWNQRQLAIVRGVGYPRPDHSHFRSMDIWQTASPAEPVSTGWIGRWLDANGDDPLRAVNIGPVLPPLAVGEKYTAAALSPGGAAGKAEKFDAIMTALGNDDPNDTHAIERATQQRLLQTLDEAVARFLQEMSGDRYGKNVVLLAYSEFGRRVRANASQGTDHGTAGPVFVAGVPVKGGFYGEEPSLTDLDNGDLKFTTDFRDVYNELLTRTVGTDPTPSVGAGRTGLGFL